MTMPPRPLPPHLIRREDVPVWLAGSAITFITAHRTSAEDTIDDQERLDEFRAAAGDADASVVLRTAGYDGVVVHFGQAETWVIAYSEDQIKVVVER